MDIRVVNQLGYVMATVVLSERNIRDLYAAVEDPDSQFREGGLIGPLSRETEPGLILSIIVEPDAQHYGVREPGPGLDPSRYEVDESTDAFDETVEFEYAGDSA